MKPIVRVNKISKRYRLGTREAAAYSTLRDSLVGAFRAPFRSRRTGNGNSDAETIWALKDISFTVDPGEVVGIIGSNGAGKSTLLKLLSRITPPTSGQVDLYGRVASLLEVGTGFHPELSGRENIYLNGAILGMKKAEINSKFDQIVAFAELEDFLDTPVKRYSTGMYMRLAFAVASHLEPQILLIDEVLAVGDARFQRKCLGRMSDVASEGRTVLFVSHNMVAVQSMCKRVLWLNRGEVVEDGAVSTVVSNYLKEAVGSAGVLEESWTDVATAPGNDVMRLCRISVRRRDGVLEKPLTMKSPLVIEIEYWNFLPDAQLHIALHLYTEQDIIAFTTGNGSELTETGRRMAPGRVRCTCYVPGDLLNAGRHRFVVLVVRDGSSVIYRHVSTVLFEILDLEERAAGSFGKEPGVVQPVLNWKTECLGETPRSTTV